MDRPAEMVGVAADTPSGAESNAWTAREGGDQVCGRHFGVTRAVGIPAACGHRLHTMRAQLAMQPE